MQTSTPLRPKYTGFLSGFLRVASEAEELHAHWLRLSMLKRPTKAATRKAVLAGYLALQSEAKEKAEHLRDRGQLLFAHADTTYFQHWPHVGFTEAWPQLSAALVSEEVQA